MLRAHQEATRILHISAERTQIVYIGCRLFLGLHSFIPRLFTVDYFSWLFLLMASTKYDLPPLDRTIRFALWQVKMRAMLIQAEVEDALDKFGNKDSKSWTDEDKRKERKAWSQIQLHLSNDILQDCLQEKTAAALWLKLESICMSKDLTSKMHMKMKL